MGRKIFLPISLLILAFILFFFFYPQKGGNLPGIKKKPAVKVSAPTPEIPEVKNIRYINRENSRIIALNDRFNPLPFHPIKLKFLENKIYFLDRGNLYYLDLGYKFATPVLAAQNNRKEFTDLAVSHDKVYLLDKLNNIYAYFPRTKSLETIIKTKFTGVLPDPQFSGIAFNNMLYILDTAGNQLFYTNNGKNLSPFFTSVNMPGLPEARDLTNSIAFYPDGQGLYILKRQGFIDIYHKNNFQKRSKITGEYHYGFLGMYSEPSLKNIYLAGGYNGNILALAKKSGEISGSYIIRIKNKYVPVYDLCISGNTMYILAGNYLVIYPGFKENQFEKINYLPPKTDLLFKAIDNPDIWAFKIPLKPENISLPVHPGFYPGARRLYRYGIHEGIDFFSEPEKKIKIDSRTPVIAAQDGMISRADKNYRDITVSEHDRILKQCAQENETSPQNADKLRGRQVRILHNGNLVTVYAHLSKIAENIKENMYIRQGEIIGYVGNTGTTDGVYHTGKNLHLHFEIHIDDHSADLEYYLGKYLTIEETMQIYKRILH
jgi:murein DD-endopeptidase MepM/ murein hydrolase activator NlpD